MGQHIPLLLKGIHIPDSKSGGIGDWTNPALLNRDPEISKWTEHDPSDLSGLAAGRPVSVAERSHRCCSKAPETRPESRQAQQFESHVGGCELPSWNRRGSEPRNEASGVVLKNASVASLLISRAIAHPYFFIKDASLRSALF